MKGCKALSDGEIQAIRERLKGARDRALFTLGLKTGFRISELLSLKVSDVWQFGSVVKEVSVSRRNMKKKTEGRTVPLHEVARGAIQALIESEGLQPNHYLFGSRKGANRALTAGQAWRILNAAAEAAHVQGKVGTHSMRKSFAGRVYELLERDLLKTQAALGHKSINSTVSYLSFAQEDVTEAILSA